MTRRNAHRVARSPDLQALLSAVLENPSEDGPRLDYAHGLISCPGGSRRERAARRARAEFIRSQLEWASDGSGYEPGDGCLTQRESDLADEFSDDWTGGPHADGVFLRYHRGFVGWVMASPAGFAQSVPRLMTAEPVEAVSLCDDWDTRESPLPDDWLAPLATVGELRPFWSIDLGWQPIADGHVRQLLSYPCFAAQQLHLSGAGFASPGVFAEIAGAPSAARLRSLVANRLGCPVLGDESPEQYQPMWGEAVAALAASPYLRGLARLRLNENALPPEVAQPLASADWPLELLDVSDSHFGDAGAVALARSDRPANLRLLYLARSGVGDKGVGAMADSPHLACLEFLDLSGNEITDRGARVLAGTPHLPRLRHLTLDGNRIGRKGKAALRERFGNRVTLNSSKRRTRRLGSGGTG